MWFIDKNSPNHWIYHRVGKRVLSTKTRYQKVDIFDTPEFGRMVVLDGLIQSAQSDEFIYHEILVHPAMITHPKPKHVLVLGAGEGATLREVLRHSTVRHVVMVDIDREFVELCKRYLPAWHRGSFESEKVEVVFEDAFRYLQGTDRTFDVIIADISDPSEIGPARSIYTARFYALVRKALRADGIFVTHATAVHYAPHKNDAAGIARKLSRLFPHVDLFYEYVPSFGSLWSFAAGSAALSPKAMSPRRIEERLRRRGVEGLSFYGPASHGRIFALPLCVQQQVLPRL